MSKTYTYTNLAEDMLRLLNGEVELSELDVEAMTDKAEAFLASCIKKAEYSAANKGKRTPKGASPETKEKADAIRKVLTGNPMTAAEIATACGTDWTALQIANAIKYIEGADKTKVVRKTTNSKGLTAEKEYTAYFIG